MKLNDIIKSYNDRLFIVDPECFIIFTGDFLDEKKPFIRIGNWINMPIELILLIEHIIIPDNIIGNPSHEQFNINIMHPASNKYIGSEHIIKKYLDFQKLFNINLSDASIISIEKDIPELSSEKNILQKDQFVGVFYKGGNFKAVYNKTEILDFQDIEKNSIDYINIHSKLHEENKNSNRYKGSGIIILDRNPIIYHNNHFTPYLFPSAYFEAFSKLNIDPAKIRQLIYPSSNFVNLTNFLKWKHRMKENIKIFSDYDQISIAGRLFFNAIINMEKFSRLAYSSGDGLSIENYKKTFNIKLTFGNINPASEKISIALIKETSGIRNILQDSLDAIFIDYSSYEETNLLFKSSSTPVAIINDGNKNISKLQLTDINILEQDVQYDFQKYNDINEIYHNLNIDDNTIFRILHNEPDEIAGSIKYIIDSGNDDFKKNKDLFNIASIISLFLYTTGNKKNSLLLKSIYQDLKRKIDMQIILKNSAKIRITLIFYNNTISQFISCIDHIKTKIFFDQIPFSRNLEEIPEENMHKYDPIQVNLYKKIVEDRARLGKIIDLYINNSKIISDNNEIILLKEAIEKRKKQYLGSNKIGSHEVITNKNIMASSLIKDKESPPIDNQAGLDRIEHGFSLKRFFNSIPGNIKLFSAVIFTLILASFLVLNLFNRYFTNDGSVNKNSPGELSSKKHESLNNHDRIIKKYNIKISNPNIYNYANNVAIKNGYNKISYSNLKLNNPNWIYPSNIFSMLDGEKITVKKGDTLWNLSKNKLIKKNIKFFQLIEKINSLDEEKRAEFIEQAKKNSFSKEHLKIINNLRIKKK